MRLRITEVADEKTPYLKIDGELLRSGVEELATLCHSIEGEFALDLFDLRRADDAGIEALRGLLDSGVKLRRASPYVKALLGNGEPALRE